VLMVQGQLAEVTAAHFLIASKTGQLAVLPALGFSFTHHARYFSNRWVSSIFFGICTFVADAAIHPSHFPGKYTEAALTAVGSFLLSSLISMTPIGKRIDGLAEAFLTPHHNTIESSTQGEAAE
jgi:hypothetical protein